MSVMSYAPTVINAMMTMSEFEGNDRETIQTVVEAAFKILAPLVAKSTSDAVAAASTTSKRAATSYVFFGQCFNSQTPEKKALIDGTVGPVVLDSSAKYAEKTAAIVAALDGDKRDAVFRPWDSVSDAFAAVKAAGFSGFAANAVLWKCLTPAQQTAVAELQKSGTMPVGKSGATAAPRAPAAAIAGSAPVAVAASTSGKRKDGHNVIKTLLAVALKLPAGNETRDRLDELQKIAKFAGKNSLTLGVAIWGAMSKDDQERWHSTTAGLPSERADKVKQFDANPVYYELLNETVDKLLEAAA